MSHIPHPRLAALIVALFVCASSFAAEGRAQAQTQDPLSALEGQYQRLFQSIAPSVVIIENGDRLGTGFFVREDGLILTNAHVIRDARKVKIQLRSGRRLDGIVMERGSDDIDLALVKVALTQAPVPRIGRLSDTPVGSWLGAVGHGKGSVWTFNMGILSNSYSDSKGGAVFQTQIPLNPGNSGGPIFNSQGEVVGIVTSGITEANSINFGIPMEVALERLKGLGDKCECVEIKAPEGVAIFLDGQMVGVGPSLTLPMTPGEHRAFVLIDGQMNERVFSYPETQSIRLGPE